MDPGGPDRFRWKCCLLAVAGFAASQTSNIVFDETNYNFGELSETAPFSHDFIVKNGGTATLR